MPVIEAEGLVREFAVYRRSPGLLGALKTLVDPGRTVVRAVDHVSFSIDRGEVVGYLGPNGAGKSTTIKMLTGILVPTAGQVTVDGLVPHRQRRQNARHIGAVFGQRTQLWWDLPAVESLRVLAAMYDVPERVYRENMALFEQVLELGTFATRPVRQLSLGQRMRVDLAAALLHNPSVLYLDEPTIGMDVVVREQVRDFVKRAATERGTTVVLATHDLRDVERLCERVLIIDEGRLVYQGSVDSLRHTFGRERALLVQFEQVGVPPDLGTVAETCGARLHGCWNGRARFVFPAELNPQHLIAAVASRYAIADLHIEEPDLEVIIRGIYQRGKTGTSA